LELFAPNAIANVKKARFEMTMFEEVQMLQSPTEFWLKQRFFASFSQNSLPVQK
jgi:hypothetical protein